VHNRKQHVPFSVYSEQIFAERLMTERHGVGTAVHCNTMFLLGPAFQVFINGAQNVASVCSAIIFLIIAAPIAWHGICWFPIICMCNFWGVRCVASHHSHFLSWFTGHHTNMHTPRGGVRCVSLGCAPSLECSLRSEGMAAARQHPL
jgi:hypothetical protein